MFLLLDSEGPDQTAHMCSLIRIFTVHICLKTRFHIMSQIYSCRQYIEKDNGVGDCKNKGEGGKNNLADQFL